MNIEARVGVVLEGGQRALNSASIHGSIMDAGARKFLQQHNNKQGQQHSQSGTVQQLLAGGIAGAFSKTCSRAFWKGNLVTIAHRLPYSSLSFFAYERYKSFLQPVFGVENHRANGTADVAHREEDFLGLYKGLGATLLGVGPSIAISFSVYESLRSFWHSKRPNDSTVMVSLACGSLSGIASSTATFSLDLVRRRMQLEGAGGSQSETPTHVGSSDDKPFPTEVSRTIMELSSDGTLSTLTPYGWPWKNFTLK
ncbi:hypothetical protein OIU84_026038 [Salix udensis]|uniref:Mitochondrial carrier protein n=1 Tax=Salix udensis TaxID=889485 RepID=A0AAD6KLF4_9ROSI|nr:hypothetical protein OIU84_026038 [Salix udensis]